VTRLGFVLIAIATTLGTHPAGATPAYSYRPPVELGDGLRTAALSDVGIDVGGMEGMVRRIADGRFGEIHSVLVYRDGALILEEYFPGHRFRYEAQGYRGALVQWDSTTTHTVMSAGKSITSACVGIAIEQGFIGGVEDPIFDYLPRHLVYKNGGRENITIEHLLTMTSGLEWDEWGVSVHNPDQDLIRLWTSCPDQVACILRKPLASEPGTTFTYNGGNFVVLGAIIEAATGMDIEAFAAHYLFGPLGIGPRRWLRYPSGVIYAAGEQQLTPREMLKFGVLYLEDGVWGGTQIFPAEWVALSATAHDAPENSWFNHFLRSIPPDLTTWGPRGYAYSWWTHRFGRGDKATDIFYASGWGGQKIIVVPSEDLVVIFTAGNYSSTDPTLRIFRDSILPALRP
jgi:CubicO group peptidase (beta-lactamase class C family)